MLGRIKYRKQVGASMNGKRPPIAKGEILKDELMSADHFDESEKNENFGFQCLHYSVSEASGFIKVKFTNKKRVKC